MTEFQGIPIDEGILYNTLFDCSVLIAIAGIAFLCIILFAKHRNKKTPEETKEEEKREKHIRHLKKIIDKKPHLRNTLEKQLTAQKEQQEEDSKEKKENRVTNKILYAVAVGSVAFIFFFAWLPCYRDTVHKDYVSYTGTFTLEYTGGRSSGWWIVLPDGKSLNVEDSINDIIPAEEGTYTGTIVYAPRSKLVLGIEWDAP